MKFRNNGYKYKILKASKKKKKTDTYKGLLIRVVSALTITLHTGRKSSKFWREMIPSKLADSYLFLPILDPVKLSFKCENIIKLFQNYKAT